MLNQKYKTVHLSCATALMLCLTACDQPENVTVEEPALSEAQPEQVSGPSLEMILDMQAEAVQARYEARHPAETLAFFDIQPGMTVVEALPGGGWYSKILLAYLGPDGSLIGGHYPDDLWIRFGFGEDWAARRIEATASWPEAAAGWSVEAPAEIASTTLSDLPQGTADAVLFIRALHNLNRFNADGGYLDTALQETYEALKPGGIVGVVQHRAPATLSDDWASGARGYLKQDDVIARFEQFGFELVGTSEINANPLDQPTEDDFVWRLPPSLNGTEPGSPERAAMEAIGESDRMTLKFRKPD